MLISSRSNPRIKSLRRLRQRKEREESGLFLAEGLPLARAAAARGTEIRTLVLAPSLLSEEARAAVDSAVAPASREVLEVTPEVFEALSPQGVGEGVVVVCPQRWEGLPDLRLSAHSLWVAAGEIAHPGSLGTILRILDAVGGEGLIVLGNSADPYDPISVRASLGAIFTQRLVRASAPELAAWKQRHGYRVIGASPSGSTDYRAGDYHRPLVLMLGREHGGLAAEQVELCDQLVRIPMQGLVESHHVAVAAGILLYEAMRQA